MIILYVTGVIGIIVSLIVGFLSGSFWFFLFSIFGGGVFAVILFALANISEQQTSILYHLQRQERFLKNQIGSMHQCSKCQREYSADLYSCPHCGRRAT